LPPRRSAPRLLVRGAEGPLEPLAQRGLRCGADLAGDDLTAAEDEERGDALSREPPGELGRVVDVDLYQLDLAREVARQLLEGGADHTARAAPRRPEVD